MPESEIFESKPDDIPFGTDGLSTPTFYVDYIRGTVVAGGVIKLNFVENRLDALENAVKTTHVVTLITPLPQIRAWGRYFTELADQQGLPSGAEEQAAPEPEAPTDG